MKDNFLKSLAEKIPKNPGIHGSDRYISSGVLVLLVLIDGSYYFLFERRSLNIRQGGEICFPGGRYEEGIDANYQETALRETIEELGVSREKLKVLGELNTLITPMGLIIYPFVAILEIASLEELNINTYEVEEAFLLPIKYFLDNEPESYKIKVEFKPSYQDKTGQRVTLLPANSLGLPDRYKKPWSGKDREVYLYKSPKGIIWGITADLIYGFLNN